MSVDVFIKVQSLQKFVSAQESSPLINNPQNGRSFDHITAIMAKHGIEMKSHDWRMI